jgi:hypothetical protein
VTGTALYNMRDNVGIELSIKIKRFIAEPTSCAFTAAELALVLGTVSLKLSGFTGGVLIS